MEITVKSCYVKKMKNRKGEPWRAMLEYFIGQGGKKHVKSEVFGPEIQRKIKAAGDEKEEKENAKMQLEKWQKKVLVELGRMPEPKRLPPAAEMMVPDYVELATRDRVATKRLEDSTVYNYSFSLGHIRDGFSNVKMKDLTTAHIYKWVTDMSKQGLSPATISKAFRLLRKAVNRAVDVDKILEENPCLTKSGELAIDLPAPRKERPNVLDAKGRLAVKSALDGMTRSPTIIAAYLAIYTGMRRGEICGLRWGDVDLDSSMIHVSRSIAIKQGGCYIKDPKTESGMRLVPMPPDLLPIIAAHRTFMHEDWLGHLDDAGIEPNEGEFSKLYVLGGLDGKFANPTRLGKAWQAISESCNFIGTQGEPVSLHDLRHTYATIAVADSDVKSASSNLGHATTAITLDIYAGDDMDAKRRTAEIVGRAYNQSGE